MKRNILMVVLGVVALEIGSSAAATLHAQAQPPRPKKQDSIPKEYLPPAGMCRIWVDGVPAGQQPAPTDCASAVRNKPSNGQVVYGEDKKKKGNDSRDKDDKDKDGKDKDDKDKDRKNPPVKSFKPGQKKPPIWN